MNSTTRTRATALLVPCLLATPLVSGCGKSSTTSDSAAKKSSAAAPGASAGQTSPGSDTGAAGGSNCPATKQQHFAKSRFVLNVGLAGGAFHHWDYKPYKAGAFAKGAPKRTRTIVKAGLASAFAVKQLNDAKKNVQADPALCKVLYQPMESLSTKLGGLKGKLAAGDVSSLAAAESDLQNVEKLSQSKGMPITENENANIGG